MRHLEDKYISLLTDFGFKRIFGTAMNKDLLISFLNSLFNGEQVIKDVQYLNSEHVGDTYIDRHAFFDVYCENEKGEKFIVEMQNAFQTFFKDRSIYYTTHPIREQAKKGDWDYELNHVYTIGVLNFNMNDPAFAPGEIIHRVKLCDITTNRVFYHKLDLIYIELPKVSKSETELETMFDKWMFVLKNLARLEQQPKSLQNRVFDKLFKEAEIATYEPEEAREYEDSMKAYRDMKNIRDTAAKEAREKGHEEGFEKGLKEGRAEGREEGREEGRAEGRAEGMKKGLAEGEASKSLEIAKKMLAKHFPIEDIMDMTNLSREEIEKLM